MVEGQRGRRGRRPRGRRHHRRGKEGRLLERVVHDAGPRGGAHRVRHLLRLGRRVPAAAAADAEHARGCGCDHGISFIAAARCARRVLLRVAWWFNFDKHRSRESEGIKNICNRERHKLTNKTRPRKKRPRDSHTGMHEHEHIESNDISVHSAVLSNQLLSHGPRASFLSFLLAGVVCGVVCM